jgi:hypothetical protein
MSEPSTTRAAAEAAAVRRNYVYAIVITAALFLVLGSPFEYEVTAGGTPARSTVRVHSLPDPPMAETAVWQQQLLAWSELWDPTALALPSADHGFSQIRHAEFQRTPEPPPAAVPAAATIRLPAFAPLRLNAPPPPLAAAVQQAQRLSNSALPQEPAAPDWGKTAVIATLGGVALPALPALVPTADDVRAAPVSAPTTVSIESRRSAVRIRVVASCGNSALDQAAIRHLRQHYLPQSFDLPTAAAVEVTAVQFHWRYVPGIVDARQAAPDAPLWHQDEWNDRDRF